MELAVNLYPHFGYIVGKKGPMIRHDPSLAARVVRMRNRFGQEGRLEIVGAILLIHVNNVPCVLLLHHGNTFYKLPGGRLRPGENEIEGLRRKLTSQLGPAPPAPAADWQIGEYVAAWWRHDFNDFMRPYCYFNSQPKERMRLFLVHLPPQAVFQVPEDLKHFVYPLYALDPFLALHDQIFGQVISSLPLLLSRFQLNILGP